MLLSLIVSLHSQQWIRVWKGLVSPPVFLVYNKEQYTCLHLEPVRFSAGQCKPENQAQEERTGRKKRHSSSLARA